jgi:hypothetical protein
MRSIPRGRERERERERERIIIKGRTYRGGKGTEEIAMPK